MPECFEIHHLNLRLPIDLYLRFQGEAKRQ